MDLDQKTIDELKFQFETQSRLALYKKPEFPYLHSLGVWNLINAFTYTIEENGQQVTKPFAVLQLYWDKETKEWLSRWYEHGQTVQAVSYWDRYSMSEEGQKKVMKIFSDMNSKRLLKQYEMAKEGFTEKKPSVIN